MNVLIRTLRPAALIAAAAAALLLAGCSSAPVQHPVAAVGAPGPALTEGRPEAVAIGDSIAFGKGVRPDEAWPALVAAAHKWRLTDLAVSGSGFVHPGWNGTTYQQQVERALHAHPDYILIAATRNDRDEDPAVVEQKSAEMLATLHSAFPKAHIIGITAIWGDDRPPTTMTRVDGIVGKAVDGVGGTYLNIGFPLVGHPEWVQSDHIHPNAGGQDVVAKVIDSKLASVTPTL
ncbi:SGNH/GDSL hydrolase family protein [Leifsonia poae]|uniref:SGNH/GDSL hydrolase family protein n=1 Tax=Leifsonia poae TaxID=110933 RepID=UPI001CBE9A0D|nr:SGNH/GDSL hydrolase family protein [Leifsonia poae]